MLIPSDYQRVPSADIVADCPDAGRERYRSYQIANVCQAPTLLPVPPMLVRRRCQSRQISHTCEAPALLPVPVALTGTMLIPSDYKRVPGSGGDDVDPSLVQFYVDDGIFVKVLFFQDERRL